MTSPLKKLPPPGSRNLNRSVRFEMPAPEDIIILPGMSCYVRTYNEGRRYTQAGIRVPLSALTQGKRHWGGVGRRLSSRQSLTRRGLW